MKYKDLSTIASITIPVDVTFNFSPSTPDVWYLRNGDPGYPGDPAEVEITSIKIKGLELIDVLDYDTIEELEENLLESSTIREL